MLDSPDLGGLSRSPLPSHPLVHLSDSHWGAGIRQFELLVPGIFTRQLQALLQEDKYSIGLSTGLCFQNGGTFKTLYGREGLNNLPWGTVVVRTRDEQCRSVSVSGVILIRQLMCVFDKKNYWDAPGISERVIDDQGFIWVTIATILTILCHHYLWSRKSHSADIFENCADFLPNQSDRNPAPRSLLYRKVY